MSSTRASGTAQDRRVLVLAPTAKDGLTTQHLLRESALEAFVCHSIQELCREAQQGTAALLVPEEALAPPGAELLQQLLDQQETWSDLPLLVLTCGTAEARVVDLEQLGNVTLLDRPVRIATLISAVRTAIRSRQRQYQLREHIRQQELAREALGDADRRKDEFLAMLAHELRNPLAAIVSASAVLREAGDLSPVARRQQEVIERQSRHTARLVDDLLDVSRITRGRIELRPQPLEVGEVLASIVESYRGAVAARGQTLFLTRPNDPIFIHADSARFEQIVTNLLTNASKYTGRGGRISVSLEALTGRNGEHSAEMCVTDTGVGIAPELLPQVFDLFIQAERTLARSEGGLGIGLTMVRRLVEMHGGTVEARSAGQGRGSEFIVRLPAIEAPAGWLRRPGEDMEAEAGSESPKSILIVEDNQDAAQSLAELLELWGHRVSHAADGQEALRLWASLRPDLVLLDIGLPGMDGYEVAARLRSAGLPERTRLIALTGYGRQEDRQRASEAGFAQHLTKPIDPELLREVISGSVRAH